MVRIQYFEPLTNFDLDPVLDEFERELASVSYHTPTTSLISNLTGAVADLVADRCAQHAASDRTGHRRGTATIAGSDLIADGAANDRAEYGTAARP